MSILKRFRKKNQNGSGSAASKGRTGTYRPPADTTPVTTYSPAAYDSGSSSSCSSSSSSSSDGGGGGGGDCGGGF